MTHLSRKERFSFRNYGLRRAALSELTFFSLCIFVRYRSATPCLLTCSVLERLSITETRASSSSTTFLPGLLWRAYRFATSLRHSAFVAFMSLYFPGHPNKQHTTYGTIPEMWKHCVAFVTR